MVSDKKIMDSFTHKMNKEGKAYNSNDVRVYLLLYRFFEKNAMLSTCGEIVGMHFVQMSYAEMSKCLGCSISYLNTYVKRLEDLGVIKRVEGSYPFEPYFTYMSLDVR